MNTKKWLLISVVFTLLVTIILPGCDDEDENTKVLPSVSIKSPSMGTTFERGVENVDIKIEAEDKDGTIEMVRIYKDGVQIDSSTSVPYTYTWVTAGEEIPDNIAEDFIIDVVVEDNDGNYNKNTSIVKLFIGRKPNPDFQRDSSLLYLGTNVFFINKTIDYLPTEYSWEFGDGAVDSVKNPEHTYAGAGTYDVKLQATNKYGTSDTTISMPIDFSAVDGDGNYYIVKKLGNYYWTMSNLRTTKLNDGLAIPNIDNDDLWSEFDELAYCYYDDEESNVDENGILYNYIAASSDRLCPVGFHVATDAEWKDLEIFAGMSSTEADKTGARGDDEGEKLKSEVVWSSREKGTDEFGFGVIPGGLRGSDGFEQLGKKAVFWTSTEASETTAFTRLFDRGDDIMRDPESKYDGYSVRCVKD